MGLLVVLSGLPRNENRPHRNLQIQTIHEHGEARGAQQNRADQRLLEARLVARQARDQDDRKDRDDQARSPEQQGKRSDRPEHQDRGLNGEAADETVFRSAYKTPDKNDHPKESEQPAEDEREVTRPHLCRRAHGITGCTPCENPAEQYKQDACIKILEILDSQRFSLSALASLDGRPHAVKPRRKGCISLYLLRTYFLAGGLYGDGVGVSRKS